jgi:hypothetical protein
MIRVRVFSFVTLLVLFFLSMIPVSRSSSAPVMAENASSRSALIPALAYTPEPYVPVTMFVLDNNGNPTNELCKENDYRWGCTALCTDLPQCTKHELGPFPYPYDASTIKAPVQTYYLLDVLSAEMNPAMVREPQALRTQAVASRSFV